MEAQTAFSIHLTRDFDQMSRVAADVPTHRDAVQATGCEIVDRRAEPCDPVAALLFAGDPDSGLQG